MKTIKIIRNDDFDIFENEVSEHLKNNWKTKGNLVVDNGYHYMVIYKTTNLKNKI